MFNVRMNTVNKLYVFLKELIFFKKCSSCSTGLYQMASFKVKLRHHRYSIVQQFHAYRELDLGDIYSFDQVKVSFPQV